MTKIKVSKYTYSYILSSKNKYFRYFRRSFIQFLVKASKVYTVHYYSKQTYNCCGCS